MQTPRYFDYAAATPMADEVLAAMTPYFSTEFYNPSALYSAARTTKTAIENARKQVASLLGSRPGEVIFTAGGTEANNLAIQGVMDAFPGANLVISSIEHDSIEMPALQYNCNKVAVNDKGIVDIGALEESIDDQTVLVSVMYANNEIGTVQPLKQIATILEKLRKNRKNNGNDLPLYFHTDACQAANYLSLQVHQLGVDMLTLNGGKIYGPKQSGCLFVSAHVKLRPQQLGGGQEFGKRSGTENVAQIIGFAKALEIAQLSRHDETKRLQQLQKAFIDQLSGTGEFAVNGSLKHRLPNNLNLTFIGHDNERMVVELDERGMQCAVGSACSASKQEPSRVLQAIGLDDTAIHSSLRISFGRQTSSEDIVHLAKAIKNLTN